MNIAITLPRYLIRKIERGEKLIEMRKQRPKANLFKLGFDGFFCCEKGYDIVDCWCRVDDIIETDLTVSTFRTYGNEIGIPYTSFLSYANYGSRIYLWKIGKVIPLFIDRKEIFVDRNPQSFCYTPLSHGQSY